MPRQRRGAAPAPTPARSAPTRPTAAPPRPATAPQQQQYQPHSTAAHPSQSQQHAPHPPQVQQSQGPGLFGQMASTAAGVAVGSSIGHAIGGMFSGGSSAPAEPQQAAPADAQPMDNGLWQSNAATQSYENTPCATDIKNFRQCMDDHRGDMSICGWYLDQLKACQAAAKPY
ncbi:uncharacterized protein ACHE_70447S [Aspergillus chevalieri]|uniref:CHCH domain protein n=1 Tax=Aspergillus chevalieri TaxID=182096 RepID=A0A7R7VVK3_ASPCH|nr:uncharacterized protein ACHE_70447S [Aspergillus chevalieri]BCR91604.1 hypothetical protein ACHE_70447S [Aspergillus chevalieri]